jgi:hypothetical protein
MLAAQRQSNELITIVVPQFVPHCWWHNLLHTQTAVLLRLGLLFKPGIVVTDVPYHVSQSVPWLPAGPRPARLPPRVSDPQ